ncbi:MAG: Uma2 family endonuclease [Candidatus Eremiobacteraeota bacterium]|nr:Uma2 family endonuclease [Candidatus Eremiobacteraeota bacterium]
MQQIASDLPEIEYLRGQPFPKMSPKRIHASVQGVMFGILRSAGRGVGQAGTEWRFKLSSDTEFVPDVAFVSYDRLRALSDEAADEPPFAPDIAAEVRSPSHRAGFARRKVDSYIEHGALLVLDIDPETRRIHAHAKNAPESTYASGQTFAHSAVPWLTFAVNALFEDIDIPRS